MHCLNIVRCMIVYLDCINIMRFQKKTLCSLLSTKYSSTFTDQLNGNDAAFCCLISHFCVHDFQ